MPSSYRLLLKEQGERSYLKKQNSSANIYQGSFIKLCNTTKYRCLHDCLQNQPIRQWRITDDDFDFAAREIGLFDRDDSEFTDPDMRFSLNNDAALGGKGYYAVVLCTLGNFNFL